MGDASAPASSSGDSVSQVTPNTSFQGPGSGSSPTAYLQGSNVGVPTFQSQYQQHFNPLQHTMYSAQFDMGQRQGPGNQGLYNMSNLENALPQTGYRHNFTPTAPPRYNAGSGGAQQISPMAHYAPNPSSMSHMAGQQFFMPQTHLQPYYSNQMQHSQQQGNVSSRQNMGYYPNQVMVNQAQQHVPAGYYYPPPNQFTGHTSSMQAQMMPNQFISSDPRGPSPGGPHDEAGPGGSYGHSEARADTRSKTIRGPPRKPRQSGHAIWIGNLPPQTDLMNLVHHVCKEAVGLESLFLISKSNCAFANFKDEQACQTAQQKLHESNFQSVRLVSRLRKNTVEGAAGQTAPTGPAATSPSGQNIPAENPTSPLPVVSQPPAKSPDKEAQPKSTPVPGDGMGQKDKFFILKSLTVEDLELSVRNGVWATQSHNEHNLNGAFKAVDNVYLVFSANKSGEYFGYARMMSPINNDPAAAIEFAPKAQTTADTDGPKAIPTEATEKCPRGRIIDDSARGTIFWEIEREEDDVPEAAESDLDDTESRSGQEREGGSKAWGKPFKLDWLSTTKLPFYRTRGLRNPWNSNREVKIARDGTELEPSVGRRLIGLFNRVQSPAPISMGTRQGMGMVVGYPPPPMRPYAPQ